MSYWTYVIGVIEVDTCARSDAEAMYLAQTVVNHLPRITGSERNAEFHFSRPNGYCSSSNVDEFDKPSNLYDDRHFRMFTTQEKILITVHGSLRDRTFKETLRETTKMLARLSSRLWVRECLVRVRSDMGETFIFDNPERVRRREITDWTRSLLGKLEVSIVSKDERFPIMMSMFSRNQQHLDVPMVWVLNHEKQCLSNHMQTPQRLKERGGLSPKELYAVLHDMRWDDVKFSENQCLEIIKNMVLTCTHPEANAFYKYLEKLNSIAQSSGDNNFAAIQRVRSDILNSYTFGYLSDVEKRNLYNTATIIMNKMREKLDK